MRAATVRRGVWAAGAMLGLVAVGVSPAVAGSVRTDDPVADAETTEAPGPDLTTIAGGRAFALELINNSRDEEDAEMAARVASLRANLPGYRAEGPAGDVALIEAVLEADDGDLEAAAEFAERAVELSPDDPDAHYVLGTVLINDVNRGSFGLSTLGKVNRAKASWETAEELEPEHVGARISLAMFYLQAPGIAGGDKKKAARYGESLVKSGELTWGWRIQMMASIGRKRWDEARERLDSMVAAAQDDNAKRTAYIQYLVPVLLDHGREDEAFEVLPLMARVCDTDDMTLHYLWGRAYEERGDRGDRAQAISSYARAVDANEAARDSRWRLAELLRKEDRDAQAARHYAEFAERFPEHENARKAARYAERLSR